VVCSPFVVLGNLAAISTACNSSAFRRASHNVSSPPSSKRIFISQSSLKRGPLSLVRINEELLESKVTDPV
jgi:hypothetical protein